MSSGDRPAIALQDVAYGGLDAVRAVLHVDLCAYLHASPGLGPQLYLRAPDLSTLHANAAFGLFGSLRDVLGDAQAGGTQRLELGGFDSVVLVSEGDVSRGLFVFGRAFGRPDQTITDDELGIISPLCAAVGVAAHALESAVQPSVDLAGIKVVVAGRPDGSSTAEALIPIGGDIRRGTGEGATSLDAAARATLAALDPAASMLGVAPVEVGGHEIVVAVIRGDGHDVVAGVAPIGSLEPAEAVARAVADASSRTQG